LDEVHLEWNWVGCKNIRDSDCPFCDSFKFNRITDKLPFLGTERQRERGNEVLVERKRETAGQGEGNRDKIRRKWREKRER
jgi:hypothetical protein